MHARTRARYGRRLLTLAVALSLFAAAAPSSFGRMTAGRASVEF